MAQYFTDFSEYATGQQPNDWTLRFEASPIWTVEDVVGAEGGKALKAASSAAETRDGLTWDAIDGDAARDDVQIFFRALITDSGDSEILALARASGGAADPNTYRCGPRPRSGTDQTALQKYVNGTFGDVVPPSTSLQYTVGSLYNFLIQIRGTNLKLRAWESGTTEPDAWLMEGTDTDISGVGWIGLFKYRTPSAEIHVFGVGTGTDPAPRAQTGPSVTVTQTELTPGGTISGEFSNFDTIPTTLEGIRDTNTISSAGTDPQITGLQISETLADGKYSGTFTATIAALPTTGTQQFLRFSDSAQGVADPTWRLS